MASCVFGVVLIFTLGLSDAAQDFKEVSACPPDAASWTLAANAKKCQGDTPDYLCAAIENEVGKLGEICTKYGLTPAMKCAVLNQQTKNLDSVDCKAPSGCPKSPYNPSELWKHDICYGDFYGTTTTIAVTMETTANPTQGSPLSDEGGSGTGAVVAVIVVLLIIIIAVVVLLFLYKRNQFGLKDKMQPHIAVITNLFRRDAPQQENDVEKQRNKRIEEEQKLLADSEKKKEDEEQKIRKLKELLRYPVHILKQELEVKDLKENTVIYSKSIKAHFTAPLISDLQSVQSSDDYRKLDMTVVFTLLQNFCENIKPPRKGWDYEPPSDEITTGADIERIRLMWNRFCDDNLQCPQLDDVYNRMKNKFGTVAVHGDDGERKSPDKEEEGFEDIRDKVSCIKLNPDCVIEKGIIITENIESAIRHLQTRNVVILKGAIGCGKTHALKAINNYFEGKEWNTKLIKENLQLEDLKTDNGKTAFLCDNFGGRFGCHYFFPMGFIEKFEEILGKLDSGSTGNTKVVIGIHQHVFEEVKKTHNLNFLQNKNSTIEMDKLTDAETLMIFKEQQKEGHCNADPGCWFRGIEFSSVLSKLSTSPGHIGSPFLSLMYCHHHNLFSSDDFIKNPVQCLVKHFRGMREKHSTDYSCLVYVMCFQTHDLDTADLMIAAGSIDASISNNTIKNLIKQNPGYLHIEGRKATLMHDMLTIALFKSAADVEEIFRPVLQHFRIDVLLELLRPGEETQSEFYTGLAGVRKKENFKNDKKVLIQKIGQFCGRQWEHMNHPLQSDEYFKAKYEKYLTNAPTFE